MSAPYFTASQRRDALARWLAREYGDGYFNTAEVATCAVDVFTSLYDGDSVKAGRDLSQLKREGRVTRLGSQWRRRL